MGDKKASKIIMPPERKVVDIHNNVQPEQTPAPLSETSLKIINGLREMADNIEQRVISEPEFLMILPKLVTGEIPLIYMGEPVPTVMLEGILHKVVTRMALQ